MRKAQWFRELLRREALIGWRGVHKFQSKCLTFIGSYYKAQRIWDLWSLALCPIYLRQGNVAQ